MRTITPFAVSRRTGRGVLYGVLAALVLSCAASGGFLCGLIVQEKRTPIAPLVPAYIQMNDVEQQACMVNGCSVWTIDELKDWAVEIYMKGLADGRERAEHTY